MQVSPCTKVTRDRFTCVHLDAVCFLHHDPINRRLMTHIHAFYASSLLTRARKSMHEADPSTNLKSTRTVRGVLRLKNVVRATRGTEDELVPGWGE